MGSHGARVGFLLLCIGMCGAIFAQAQDHDLLIVRPPSGEDKFTRMIGDIVDLNSEQATFVSKNGTRQQKIALSRVVDIAPRRSAEETQGRRLLAAGDFDRAIASLTQAADKETHRWRKEELAALVAQAELGLGQIDAAGKRLAPLVKEDPDSRLLGYLPIAWKEDFKTPSAANLSTWAGDPSPALKLLAASWMLSGEKRREATALLEKLADGPSRRLAALAEAQLWRTRMPTAKPLDVQRWFDRIQTFPEDLRAGPYFVAGLGAARTDQPLLAAEAFLRCAVLHPMQTPLAAEAQALAVAQLEKAGASADLEALLELIASQSESYPHRAEALEKLNQLRGAASP